MAETQDTKTNKSAGNSGSVPLLDIFFMTLRNWPWIILSVVVCVGAAYVYLLRTPNVYTRAAEVMIKDESKGNTVGGNADIASFGLFQTNTNIQNEMINLKSQDLMEEVVRRLDLDINYFRDGRFHIDVAYGYDLPVKVDLIDFPDEGSVSFTLALKPDGKVVISDLARGGRSSDKDIVGQLNDTVVSDIGRIAILPGQGYQKGASATLNVKKYPLATARAIYNARLGVSISNEKASVVRLTITDESTDRADDVLATLIGVYNENWMRDRNQISVSTSNFINDRLAVIESELGNVDSDISSYKAANLTPDFDAAASMYMGKREANQDAMLEINNQLSIARYVKSYLSAEGNRDQLLPANSGLASSNVASLIGSYNEKLLKRNSLLSKSSDKNPLVKQLDEELEAQRRVIIQTIDNEIIALNTQAQALRGSEARTVAKLQTAPKQAKNLLSVERQQKVKESLYLFLLQKREENELSQAFTAYNTRIVNRPGGAGVPPTPNRANILAMAFLLGLALPFGFTYLKETLNTKVRGRKDVEDLMPPFLGEIPLYGENREKGKYGREKLVKAIVVKGGKRDVINEAFRVLRTNLEFMKIHKDGADVIAITSFNPGSGKSFLTMNLGVALALNNQRVLVIDGDMRHGSSSAYIDSPDRGLSDVLTGNIADVNDAIVVDKNLSSLAILPIGTVPPNPTELLKTQRFADIMAELRKEYDYILVDCPPIEVVADAQIIDKEADRTIFVLRAGLLERSMLPQVDKLYDEGKYKNMCIILNGTSSGHGRYGYSHSYKYGYGYGYGYGYNYGSGKSSSKKPDSGKRGGVSSWLTNK